MKERNTEIVGNESLIFLLPGGKKLELSSPQQVLFLKNLPEDPSQAIERDALGTIVFPEEKNHFRKQEGISNLRKSLKGKLVDAGLRICGIKKQNGRSGYYISNIEEVAVVTPPIEPVPVDKGKTDEYVIFEAPSEELSPQLNGHHVKTEEIFAPQEAGADNSAEQEEEPSISELKELERDLQDLPPEDQNPELTVFPLEPASEETNSLTLYLQEIGKFKLLSADEEKELGARIFVAKLALRNLHNILALLSSEQRSHAEKTFMDKRAQRLLNELDNELKQKPEMIKKKEASGEDANSERLFLNDVADNDEMVQSKKQRLFSTEEEELENQAIVAFAQQQLKFAEEGLKAVDSLINSNLRMAIYWSKKYQGRGLELLSLNSFATEGLIRAVDRFDYRKGYKFSTIARWWIKQAIMRGLGNSGSAIRLPIHIIDRLSHFYKRQLALTQETGKEISLKNAIEQEGLPEEIPILIHALDTRGIRSLDKPIGDEENSTVFGNFVPNPENLEEQTIDNTLRTDLRKEMDEILKPIESLVIVRRFGLDGDEKETLEKIGVDYGVTRERIRQIEAKALRKLRSSRIIVQLFREITTEGRPPQDPDIVIFPPSMSR